MTTTTTTTILITPAPSVDDVYVYLGDGHSFTETEIADTLASEKVAQAHLCTIPSVFPADLATALCRRVARALQMKSNPLGYEMGNEGGLSYISSHDSEVKRLEAPYRKRPIR